MTRVFSLALFLLFLAAPPARALVLNSYDADSHERFNNDASFIGNPYDWSGVSGSPNSRAAMVSDSFFVSASHAHPGVGSSVTFYHSNDPLGGSESHMVAAGTRIGNTDLWLGRLSTSVSSSVAKYPVLGISPTNVIGREVHLFGTSNLADPSQRLGRNVVDAFISDFSDPNLNGEGDVILYDFDTGAGGLGADEARVQGGDSGAPVFAIEDGAPALLGIHWFRYTLVDPFEGEGSGDSFIPSYVSSMNAMMSPFGQSLTVVAVPEPSAILLCTALTLAGACRRRRRVASVSRS